MKRPIVWILGLGLVLRLIGSSQSFWLDEAAQALESVRPLSQQFEIPNDFHPPLYHLLVHLFIYGGKSEWWLRLSSIIPGVTTIYIVYLIGKSSGNKTLGILAALLLATNPYHIYYSQELRMYSLSAMWAAGAMYAFLQRKYWLHTMVFVAGLYTIYLFPFMAVVELMMGLAIYLKDKTMGKQSLNWLMKCWVMSGLLFLPIIPLLRRQLSGGVELPKIWPGWVALSSLPALKVLPLTLIKFVMGRVTFESNLIYGSLTLVAACMVGIVVWMGRKSYMIKLGAIWWLVPIGLALGVSIWIPLNGPWRILFALPGLIIMISAGLVKIHRSLAIPILVVFLGLQLGGLLMYYTDKHFQRENWRGLVRNLEILNQASHGKMTVISAFPEPFAPLRWYTQGLDLSAPLTGLVVSQVSLDQRMREITLDHDIVVRLEYLQNLTDPDRLIPKWLDSNGYEVKDQLEYPNIGFVFIYQHQYQPVFTEILDEKLYR